MESKAKSSSLEKESSNGQEARDSKEISDRKGREARGKKHAITLGVCAMKKKVQSKPMKEILKRLRCKEVEIIEMWECLDRHWSVIFLLLRSGPKLMPLFASTQTGFHT